LRYFVLPLRFASCSSAAHHTTIAPGDDHRASCHPRLASEPHLVVVKPVLCPRRDSTAPAHAKSTSASPASVVVCSPVSDSFSVPRPHQPSLEHQADGEPLPDHFAGCHDPRSGPSPASSPVVHPLPWTRLYDESPPLPSPKLSSSQARAPLAPFPAPIALLAHRQSVSITAPPPGQAVPCFGRGLKEAK
jgi:hypothetical protein